MTEAEHTLLVDSRLSREARIIGLHIASLGDGQHEVSHDQFRIILGRGAQGLPKDQTLAGYVQELEAHDWIDRQPGGRGSPRYSFTPLQGEGKADALPTPQGGVKSLAPLQGEGKGPVYPPLSGGQKPPTSSSLPPLPPPPPPSERAIEFGDSRESMVGCRGSVVDYLATGRVEGDDRQLAYVQSIAGIIEGTHEHLWMQPDGSRLQEGRAQIIAGCLNELRQGDEVGKWFPGPPGDIRNLHSKIRYMVKSIAGAKRDAERRPRAAASSGEEPRTRSKHPEVHVES